MLGEMLLNGMLVNRLDLCPKDKATLLFIELPSRALPEDGFMERRRGHSPAGEAGNGGRFAA